MLSLKSKVEPSGARIQGYCFIEYGNPLCVYTKLAFSLNPSLDESLGSGGMIFAIISNSI